MEFIISFLEGVITFVSPCLLPMLPIYITYFAGKQGEENTGNALLRSLGFVLGFTLVFVILGAFAGLAGGFLRRYQAAVNMITGGIVILFGLSYLGVVRLPFIYRSSRDSGVHVSGFFSSVLFGMVFSVSWTPCVSAFLGSALLLASQKASAVQGILMLLCYSIGLGVPFLLSALLIDRLKTALSFIKQRYNVIIFVSGLFLIIIGILMMTGFIGKYLSILTF